jgi:hypothetical protein
MEEFRPGADAAEVGLNRIPALYSQSGISVRPYEPKAPDDMVREISPDLTAAAAYYKFTPDPMATPGNPIPAFTVSTPLRPCRIHSVQYFGSSSPALNRRLSQNC